MEIFNAFAGISSAFGLSASAGLNAYIPLLVVALTARFTNWINLPEPYNLLASWPAIVVLAALLLVEMFVDKIPAVDTVNDAIQTFIRPTAGALLFAANTNIISDLHPAIAVILGLLVAGSVHATKTAVRPAITASTAGFGNPIVSVIEDFIALITSLLAILLPILVSIVLLIALLLFWRWRTHRSRSIRPTAQ